MNECNSTQHNKNKFKCQCRNPTNSSFIKIGSLLQNSNKSNTYSTTYYTELQNINNNNETLIDKN